MTWKKTEHSVVICHNNVKLILVACQRVQTSHCFLCNFLSSSDLVVLSKPSRILLVKAFIRLGQGLLFKSKLYIGAGISVEKHRVDSLHNVRTNTLMSGVHQKKCKMLIGEWNIFYFFQTNRA